MVRTSNQRTHAPEARKQKHAPTTIFFTILEDANGDDGAAPPPPPPPSPRSFSFSKRCRSATAGSGFPASSFCCRSRSQRRPAQMRLSDLPVPVGLSNRPTCPRSMVRYSCCISCRCAG